MFNIIFSCNLHLISCSICEFDHTFSTFVTFSKFTSCGKLSKLSFLINNLVSFEMKDPGITELWWSAYSRFKSFLFLYSSKILSLQGAAAELPLIHNLVFPFKTKDTGITWRWYSAYSHYAQWCGSFHCHQEGSGSLWQKGWAPRV